MISPRRKRARKAIALREQLAAALAMLLPEEERTALREQKVPAKRVISLFQMHHIVFHAIGGSDKWENLHPMLREDHRERSRTDTSTIAKVNRIMTQHEDFRRIMLKKSGRRVTRDKASRWPQGRKLQSRNDLRREHD